MVDSKELLVLPPALRHYLEHAEHLELLKIASKGANGYVCFAKNTITRRDIALKFYFWGIEGAQHAEPKSLAKVQHDHIIPVLSAGFVDEDWAYFETPYLPFGDLDVLIETREFDLHVALQLTADVADAVGYLHSHSLLHCDLKPENILFSPPASAVIADFGSIRALPVGQTNVPGSSNSQLYRPPESFETGHSRKGDIYQCGMVLLQLVGAELPYDEMAWLNGRQRQQYAKLDRVGQSKLVDSVVEAEIRSGRLVPKRIPDWLPPQTKRIIRKSTHVDPNERYDTASDLRAALHEHRVAIPKWAFTGGLIQVEADGKRYRVVGTGGTCFVEKESKTGWRRDNSFGTGELRAVLSRLRSRL